MSDAEYERAGERLADAAEEVLDRSELVVKVKEPQAPERAMRRPDHVLFRYLHLAADPEQAMDLCARGSTCIAYEMVTGRPCGAGRALASTRTAGTEGSRCHHQVRQERAPMAWQTTVALAWIEVVIDSRFDLIANRLYFLEEWFSKLRKAGVLEGEVKNQYHRISDGQAAAGDRAAVRLQQLDE